MNMTKTATLCLTILLGFACGCVRPPGVSTSSKSTTNESSEEREKARRLSDSIVDNLVRDSRTDLRAKMERGMRDYYDEKSFSSIVDQMFGMYGKPLEAEYKMDDVGSKTYPDGQSKPMRKFWYSVRTTKHEKGSHYLFVEIVPDEGGLAGSSFAIVTFPLGAPPALR